MTRESRFLQIVADGGPRLLGLLFRYTRDRDVAEELLQDVWLRAWREFDGLDPARDPMPWLRTLAIHRAIDWLRSAKTRAARPLQAGCGEIVEDGAPASGAEKLEISLAGLSADERAAILLYYQDSLPIVKIAELLNCAPATVKTWLFRARQKLKLQFEREGIRK